MCVLPAGDHQQLPLIPKKSTDFFGAGLHGGWGSISHEKVTPSPMRSVISPAHVRENDRIYDSFPACGRGNSARLSPGCEHTSRAFPILPKSHLHHHTILVECKIFLPLQFLIDKPGERVYHGFNSLKQTTAMIRPVAPLCGSSERRRWVQVLSAVWCGESPLEAVPL